MCKAIENIKEKQSMLKALKNIIERINLDIESSNEAAKNEADMIADLREDPETNKWDIQWREQNRDEYMHTSAALMAIKKHLEKLI